MLYNEKGVLIRTQPWFESRHPRNINGGGFIRMARIPGNAEGYVKASVYILLKRKYTMVTVIAVILFVCFICAIFIHIKPAGTDIPTDSASAESGEEENVSDIESLASLSAQENADLRRQVTALENELEKIEREHDGALLLEDAFQLGHSNILLNLDDITVKSNAAEYQLNDLLQERQMKGLGWEFLKAEREFGVNAIALIVLITLETDVVEQGAEVRYILRGRVGDIDSSLFSTYEECIDYFARIIGDEYLSPNGRFFAGKSFVDVYTALTGDIEAANDAASGAAEDVDRLNTTRG